MGWGKLKTKASEDHQHRVQERGPMDVNQMLNVWKKGAPMKARMGAMFSKAKSMAMLRRRGSVQPTSLTVETDLGAESADGPRSAPASGKRSLKGLFGKVKVASMLGSPLSSDKYVAPDSGNGQKPARSVKSVFSSVRDANRLSRSPSQDDTHRRSAWTESPATNPGEMRDEEKGSSPRCASLPAALKTCV